MSEELGLNVPIRSSADNSGFEAAARGAKHTKDEAENLKHGFDELGYSAENLKKLFLEAFALAEVIKQLKEGVEGSLEMEIALRGLDTTSVRLGKNVKDVREEVEGFAEALGRVAGVEDDQVVAAVTKHYRVTGDLQQAMARVKLAADVWSGGGAKTFEEAEALVTDAVNGKTKALVSLLGPTVATGTASERSAKAIKLLGDQFGGASEKVDDHAATMRRLEALWKNIREGAGAAILWLVDTLVIGFKQWGAVVGGLAAELVHLGSAGLSSVEVLSSAFMKLLKGDFQGALESVKTGFARVWQDLKTNTKATFDFEKEEWKKAADHYVDTAGLAVKARVKGNKGLRDDIQKDEKGLLEFELETLRARERAALTSEEKIRIARQVATKEAEVALSKLKVGEADYAKKREEIERALTAKLRGLLFEQFKNEDEREKKTEQVTAETVKRILAIRKHEAEEENRISWELLAAKQEALRKEVESQRAAADAALNFMGAVWGDSKEFAIAQAVVNTYQGAARAFADYAFPYSAIVAALVIAAGIAQVAKIESAEPAVTGSVGGNRGGFDDPMNDRAARLAGYRFGTDLVGEWSKGMSGGWGEAMSQARGSVSNSYDYSHKTTIHLSGGVIDSSDIVALTKLKRNMDLVAQNADRKRTLSRAGIRG